MTWPRWLRRAVRNRHRHAIEQCRVDGVEVDAAIQDERAVNLIPHSPEHALVAEHALANDTADVRLLHGLVEAAHLRPDARHHDALADLLGQDVRRVAHDGEFLLAVGHCDFFQLILARDRLDGEQLTHYNVGMHPCRTMRSTFAKLRLPNEQ